MLAKGDASGATSTHTDIYRKLFVDDYLMMQYAFVQFFADHLADVSRVFEADLQSVLVLAIIGQMELEARIRSRFDGQGGMPPDALVGRPPRINASSLAAVTGIPRETVRRKLEGLAQRGWVERDSGGLWHIKTEGPDRVPVRRELGEIDRRQMERVSRLLGQMHALAVKTLSPAGAIELPTKHPAA
jgi:hypothetical protein